MRHGRKGQALPEYTLLVALLAAVAIVALIAVGVGNKSVFSNIASQMVDLGSRLNATPTTPAPGVSGPTNPGDSPTISGTGFGPGAAVSVVLSPPVASGDSAGVLAVLTADGAGAVSGQVPLPPDALPGQYQIALLSAADSSAKTPVTLAGNAPAADPDPMPAPPVGTTPNMGVAVNDCSAVYVRAAASLNSVGAIVAPGTNLIVYAVPVSGGTWPPSGVTSCDGTGNTWYQISTGAHAGAYVFTGAVHISDADFVEKWSCNFAGTGSCADTAHPLTMYAGDVWLLGYTTDSPATTGWINAALAPRSGSSAGSSAAGWPAGHICSQSGAACDTLAAGALVTFDPGAVTSGAQVFDWGASLENCVGTQCTADIHISLHMALLAPGPGRP